MKTIKSVHLNVQTKGQERSRKVKKGQSDDRTIDYKCVP